MKLLRPFARFTYRRRWWLTCAFVVSLVAALIYGSSAERDLVAGGFDDPSSESARATRILEDSFDAGEPDVVVAYSHPKYTVHDPAFARALKPVFAELARRPSVVHFTSPDGTPPALISKDGRTVVVTIQLHGSEEAYEALEPILHAEGLETSIGGAVPGSLEAQAAAKADLVRGELIALPLVAFLLVFFFRGVVLALMPVLVGAFAVASALASLRILGHFTEVSIFAMNIVTFLGLGVAVDYSLFMTSRFREELDAGRAVESAVENTMTTSGRTIFYSGLAVATSVLGLLLLPTRLLHSVAISGALVVSTALIATLVFLPAGLSILGHRIEWLSFKRRPQTRRSWWSRIASMVMRAPIPIALVTTAILLLLGVPFLRMDGTVGGAGVLPAEAGARRVAEIVASDQFPPGAGSPIQIVAFTDGPVLSPEGLAAIERYTQKIEELPDVARVLSTASFPVAFAARSPELKQQLAMIAKGDHTMIRVTSPAPADSPEAQALVKQIRSIVVPGVRALVAGETARVMDLRESLRTRIPWAVAWICLSTFVVLFLAFGSVVMPLKAIIMNVLSLAASFGALVFIFQDGRFERLLDYRSPGNIELTIPVVMFAVVFGLAMDYELFLLSRIREAYEHAKDTHASVGIGLERTGRIITRAAILLIAVMLGFMTADMLLVKEIGVAMAIAILVDVTVVRALLVPATMQLLGRFNWWSPDWLLRVWRRWGIGIEEGGA